MTARDRAAKLKTFLSGCRKYETIGLVRVMSLDLYKIYAYGKFALVLKSQFF